MKPKKGDRCIYVGKERHQSLMYGLTGRLSQTPWGFTSLSVFTPDGPHDIGYQVLHKELYFPSLQPTRYCPKP